MDVWSEDGAIGAAIDHIENAVRILLPVAGNHRKEEHGKQLMETLSKLDGCEEALELFRTAERERHGE